MTWSWGAWAIALMGTSLLGAPLPTVIDGSDPGLVLTEGRDAREDPRIRVEAGAEIRIWIEIPSDSHLAVDEALEIYNVGRSHHTVTLPTAPEATIRWTLAQSNSCSLPPGGVCILGLVAASARRSDATVAPFVIDGPAG